MNPHDPADAFDAFDARAREVHAQSLDHLSPRVQAQLAQCRRAALAGTPRRTSRGLLPWAGMATAGLALALVVQLRPPAPHVAPSGGTSVAAATPAASRAGPSARAPSIDRTVPVAPRLASADVESIAPDLSEDPEFYLWLGDAPARTE